MMVAPNGDQHCYPTGSDDLVIFAKNARINTTTQLTQLLAELRDIAWDIILFSETRTKTAQQILDGGHVLYISLDFFFFIVNVTLFLRKGHPLSQTQNNLYKMPASNACTKWSPRNGRISSHDRRNIGICSQRENRIATA